MYYHGELKKCTAFDIYRLYMDLPILAHKVRHDSDKSGGRKKRQRRQSGKERLALGGRVTAVACPWLLRNSGCFGVACFFSSPSSSSSASPSSSPSRHHRRRQHSASSSSPVCPRQASSSSSPSPPSSSSSSPSILIAVIAIVIIVTVNIIVIAISRLRSFCDHAAVPAQAEVARGRRRGRGNVRCNTHPRCPPCLARMRSRPSATRRSSTGGGRRRPGESATPCVALAEFAALAVRGPGSRSRGSKARGSAWTMSIRF